MHHQENNRISQHRSIDRTVRTGEHAIAPMTVIETCYTSRARCDLCDWDQRGATMGSVKYHVMNNPGHQVTAQWAATETFQAQ